MEKGTSSSGFWDHYYYFKINHQFSNQAIGEENKVQTQILYSKARNTTKGGVEKGKPNVQIKRWC